jgi:hypothetical protein
MHFEAVLTEGRIRGTPIGAKAITAVASSREIPAERQSRLREDSVNIKPPLRD